MIKKNPLKKESELAIATLLFYQKDYDASIDALMNIYTNNKGNIYEQKAIAGLKDAYKAKDELPAYYDWLEQESIQKVLWN